MLFDVYYYYQQIIREVIFVFALALEETIYVTTDKRACSPETVQQLLSQTHWASSRSLETVRISIENSTCFYMMCDQQLIGFARVITDRVTFAYLSDVVIHQDFQGTGAGTQLIESILNNPQLKDIAQWRLKTTYASAFYSRFGFNKVSDDIAHMEYYPTK